VRGVEVDDHGGGVVEEDPVVARDDDDSGRARDELLDEGHGHVVEVVRGLVEEDAVRSPRDDRSQGETGPLPAGERVDRSPSVEVAQPEVGGSEVGPAVGSPGVVCLGPGELAGILLPHGGVTRAQPGSELLEASHGVVERGEDLGEDLGDRRAGGEVGLLFEVGDVARTQNASRVGLVGAGEQAQQGGLADAVLTDEADRLAGVGDEVDAVEDGAVAEGTGDVAGDEGSDREVGGR